MNNENTLLPLFLVFFGILFTIMLVNHYVHYTVDNKPSGFIELNIPDNYEELQDDNEYTKLPSVPDGKDDEILIDPNKDTSDLPSIPSNDESKPEPTHHPHYIDSTQPLDNTIEEGEAYVIKMKQLYSSMKKSMNEYVNTYKDCTISTGIAIEQLYEDLINNDVNAITKYNNTLDTCAIKMGDISDKTYEIHAKLLVPDETIVLSEKQMSEINELQRDLKIIDKKLVEIMTDVYDRYAIDVKNKQLLVIESAENDDDKRTLSFADVGSKWWVLNKQGGRISLFEKWCQNVNPEIPVSLSVFNPYYNIRDLSNWIQITPKNIEVRSCELNVNRFMGY